MERWCTSPATSAGRSARSRFPLFRASVRPSALRRQRWWKRSDEGWNRRQRCVQCKMERSGCKGWSTITVRMPCASWTRAHAAEYVNEIGQAVQAAGGRLPTTWLTGLLHRLKHQGPARVLTHLAWLAAGSPSPLIREKLAYLQKRETHMQYPTRSGKQAGPSAPGASKVPTREWSKPASRGPACAGVGRTSTPCSCCAMRSAIGSGTRPGRQRWLIDKRFARVGGKQTVSSSWPRPVGSSSSGERGWTGCPTHRSMLPPHRRLRPSRSNQLVVLALAIPGANLFSDALLPPLRFQKRRVQKNETHPYPGSFSLELFRAVCLLPCYTRPK